MYYSRIHKCMGATFRKLPRCLNVDFIGLSCLERHIIFIDNVKHVKS